MQVHRKGPPFERQMCKALSLWISGGERDDVFWRTAMSGGRATIGLARGIRRDAQAGDVGAIDPLGNRLLDHVVVELKDYRDVGLFTGITNDGGKLYRFWRELQAKASAFERRPLLIARQAGMPIICLLSGPTALQLFGLTQDHASAILPRWGCHIVLWDCFCREAAVPSLGEGIGREGRRRVA